MKGIIHKLLFSFVALTLTTTMFAQENPSKKSAKKVAETSSQADHIHGKKIQQKQLHASPEVLNQADSVTKSQKKSPAGNKKTKKKNANS